MVARKFIVLIMDFLFILTLVETQAKDLVSTLYHFLYPSSLPIPLPYPSAPLLSGLLPYSPTPAGPNQEKTKHFFYYFSLDRIIHMYEKIIFKQLIPFYGYTTSQSSQTHLKY